ncbi:TPA: hypothetical protein PXP42_002798 [Yersinia enterocolitica]|nr:hypothetical protein [Yersinia enterocolitica]
MNDLITPILKLLSSLVTPRAAIRYIFVGVALSLSWIKIKPYMEQFGLPAQIAGLSSSLVGIGIGTVASATLFLCFDIALATYKEKKEASAEARKKHDEELVRIEKQNSFIELFKNNIHHYDIASINILKNLCKRDETYSTDLRYASVSDIQAIEGLHSNKVIYKTMNINIKKNVYSINPILKNWLVVFFDNQNKQIVADYLESLSPSQSMALTLLEDNGKDTTTPLYFPIELVKTNYHFSPCIDCNADDNLDEPFYFEFRDDFHSYFEAILNKKFLPYIEVFTK